MDLLSTASKMGVDKPSGGLSSILAQVPAMLLIFPSPKIPLPIAALPCLFKPEKLKFRKGTTWNEEHTAARNAPTSTFTGGDAERLEVKLFFEADKAGFLGVTGYIFFLKQLMQRPPILLQQPPLVMFMWGMTTSALSYIKDMSYEYTLFDPTGKPLYAEVDLTLVEYNMEWAALVGQNPTSRSEPRKTWIVNEGQTLDWIAYQEYGDPAQWRHIAQTNNLSNPMELKPGMILKLTPLP